MQQEIRYFPAVNSELRLFLFCSLNCSNLVNFVHLSARSSGLIYFPNQDLVDLETYGKERKGRFQD